MREIKFRGKRLDNGKWEYGYVVFAQDKSEARVIRLADTELVCEEVVPDTVGQFTGLYDKTGKEIYEGDILLLPANTMVNAYEAGEDIEERYIRRFAVVWAKQCQGFGLCLPYEAHFNSPDVGGMAAVDRMYIVGNIYE